MGILKKIKRAASGLIGGVTGMGGADAAKDASRAQQAGLREAIGTYNTTYDQQAAMLQPQQQIGNNALNMYAGLLGVGTGANGNASAPDYSAFFQSPGYQFQQEQGEQTLGRAQSARGNLFSGGAGKELMRFNNGLAAQGYNDYANRLGQFANLGPQTNNLLSGYLGQRGASIGAAQSGIGDARASGYVNSANSYNNAAGNLLNFATSFIKPPIPGA